jgi:hypothetical protein
VVAERRSPRTLNRPPAPRGAGGLAFCALLAGALAAPGGALAEAPRGFVELGGGGVRLDYAEYGPTGVLLDRETGWLPEVAVALGVEADRWFAGCRASGSEEELRYAGLTQSSNPDFDGLPVTSTSGARFLRFEVSAGARLGASRRLAAYAGAAGTSWRRRIRPTTVVSPEGVRADVEGLRERYEWAELHAGGRWSAVRTRRLEVVLDVRLLAEVAGRVAVEVPGDDVRLALRPRPGFRLALESRHELAAGWYASAEAHAGVSAFGASDVDRGSGFHEPDSVTRTAGLAARLGRSF